MMVGAFDTDPSVQTLQHYLTFLNVGNVSKDIYQLDELANVFNVNPMNQGSPIIFFK
jgi:hypothetical protein